MSRWMSLKKLKIKSEEPIKKESKKLIDDEIPVMNDGGNVRTKKNWKDLGFRSKDGIGWWDRRKLKKKPEISFLIKMLFSNGTCKEFVVSTSEEVFTYRKRTYYLKYDDAYFNLTQNQFELTYFDDHPVPLDKSIIKRGDKAFWSVSPENLKPLIDMNYVKVLASSTDIDKYLKMTATLCVLITMLSLITLLLVFGVRKTLTGGSD